MISFMRYDDDDDDDDDDDNDYDQFIKSNNKHTSNRNIKCKNCMFSHVNKSQNLKFLIIVILMIHCISLWINVEIKGPT